MKSLDLMQNIPWLASCFAKIKKPNKNFSNSSARSRSGSFAVAAIIAVVFATRITLMFGSDDGGIGSGSKPC
jgi:hypothetical protein